MPEVPDHLGLVPLINTGSYFVKYSLVFQVSNCPGYGKEYSYLARKGMSTIAGRQAIFRVLPFTPWFGMTRSLKK